MNTGQQKFYEFILERVKDGCADEAKTLMLENFKRQDEGAFTPDDMRQTLPHLISLIKPEFLDDLKQAAAHMSSTLAE